ncbi:MAG: DUF1957 domain-containing protein [Treponema sp.]|nr:DUF1957 domain-containing protein [Treponema sp.]
MKKNISIVLKTEQDFIRHGVSDCKENAPLLNNLFDSISEIYIPLLNLLDKLNSQNVSSVIGLVLPPVLCEMLEDTEIQKLYIEWLDKRIALGKKELERCSDNEKICSNINSILAKNEALKNDFCEKYNQNLVKAFSDFNKKGMIELIATTATDIFMPHYADLKEALSAQIECGLHSFRCSFGEFPDGFWIPELGYFPGIEKLIRPYGFSYTILDSRSFLLAQTIPSKGIFYPARTDNSLVMFANDPYLEDDLYSENGYVNSACYRNENRDIGFELSSEELEPFFEGGTVRFPSGYKYWNKKTCSNDFCFYDEGCAKAKIEEDAHDFLKKRSDLLNKACELMPESDFASLVCTFNLTKLKSFWNECLLWLEALLTKAPEYGIDIVSCNSMLANQFSLEKFKPYYSSCAGVGYGENLLSSKNCWMMRYVRKATERMLDLADRFPTDTGLKTRLLDIGTKELMIAQSSVLAKMIDADMFPEYCEKRFRQSIINFTKVFDSLGSNTVSTEWLTNLETKDNFFPWMNYRIYSKKK